MKAQTLRYLADRNHDVSAAVVNFVCGIRLPVAFGIR